MNDKFCAGKALTRRCLPELAMLQSFSSGPTFREVLNEKPRPVCAGGVLESCVVPVLRRIADDHHHTHDDHCGGWPVGSSFALNMEVVIRDLVGFCLTIFIQAQLYRGDNGKFFFG